MPERCLRELVRCGERDVKTRPDPVTPLRNRDVLTQCFFEERVANAVLQGMTQTTPKVCIAPGSPTHQSSPQS